MRFGANGIQVLDENDNPISIEDITTGYTISFNADLDSEDFGTHTINKFVFYAGRIGKARA